jgi:hypothetical protein
MAAAKEAAERDSAEAAAAREAAEKEKADTAGLFRLNPVVA